ncbi:putative 2-oxoglutarate-dependent dioxygenase [Neofusicoccum parvum]|nr:putative 2-oxoglutarate-dependent dioxygenase [Neofusicoccum parvum]
MTSTNGTTATALPIIDLSPYLTPTSPPTARAATAASLAAACRDTGFFYLTNHGIPAATLDGVLGLARRFFLEASAADKAAIARAADGARGYQRVGENVTKGRRDWHEAVDLYEEAGGEGADAVLRGPNRWPRHPAELREVYEGYIEMVKGVGTAVVRAMGEALGLEGEEVEVFVRATRRSFWVMRLIGYPELPEGEGREEGISCGEHTGMCGPCGWVGGRGLG